MKMHRCLICGETYLGSDRPSHCPFCGAHAEFMLPTRSVASGLNDVALTEIEREDLDEAIALERSNARFYRAVAALPGDEGLSSAYKRLANVEAEHCSLFSKLARLPKPSDLTEPSEPPAGWAEAIAESKARELKARDFYATAAGRATNDRIREVFGAISAVEADHLVVDEVAQEMLGD